MTTAPTGTTTSAFGSGDALAPLLGLANAVPGILVYWDRSLRCSFANQAYLDWFGKRSDQVLGHTVAEIFGEAYLEAVREPMDAALPGKTATLERRTDRAGAAAAVHQIHYIPQHDDAGRIAGLFVMAFDITALRQAQAELSLLNASLQRSRDEARAANRAKSSSLANRSHEIRTPMNAILGLTHLLSRDIDEPRHRQRLSRVEGAATHLLWVITDILDLSKIDVGRLVLDEADFSRNALVARVVGIVSEAARRKGLALRLAPTRCLSVCAATLPGWPSA